MRDPLDPTALPRGESDAAGALDVLDARLMRILLVLLTERTVSRAAVRLNMSQPATSAALKRLRTLLGDPLLVRSRYGMVPTEFGARLIEPLRNALRVIDFLRIQQPRFDARTSVRTYRIGCPDYLNVLFVPKLVALFRERAPDAQLVFHPLGDGFDDERALADGELDIVIDNRPARASRFRQDDLFDDRVVCLMRATHPLARRGTMTASEFADAPQLCPTPSWLEASGAIDRQLERVGLQRRIVVTLPHFELAAHALVRTDMLLTTTYRLARHYAKLLPLAAVALPAEPPDIVYRMTWNESGECVEGVRWLRGLIAEATRAWLDVEAMQPAVAAVAAGAVVDVDARNSTPVSADTPEPARRTRRRQATHCHASHPRHVPHAARIHRLATKPH
ncbi:LysR family transcriptional regulator [Burkholderia sp. AU38729]|uniref:LysR family transcriptional regulator n=1 Tax=Burkholderia sp. AU38729 TaxID=2879633 RepID=UPI001CF10551|nr:LysR family transcriptional regulator [Burkholderia sp. AU38729]MCA8062192.1 LysR family transcriptional regulator [Burkholderia sp. AU38729]